MLTKTIHFEQDSSLSGWYKDKVIFPLVEAPFERGHHLHEFCCCHPYGLFHTLYCHNAGKAFITTMTEKC